MATRHERVIIDLEDRFTMPAARMAAGTAMFRKNLDDSGRSIIAFDKTVKESGASIDKLSGRLGLLTRAAAALGPGLAPITTAMVPAVAGLSTQLGFAAAGAGTAVLAFKGVGDALEAVNAYQLKPTAENFAKLQEKLHGLGPAAREFVFYLDEIGPKLQSIRTAAQNGLLPGAMEGLEGLMTRLPQVRRIVSEIATTTGELMGNAGQDLGSGRWDEFFNFLESEARPALLELGETTGHVAKGIAELWMALNPLSDDFTGGLLDASAAFEEWATSLDQTEGFQEFMAYVRETGPQVLDTLGSLANMLLQIAEAAAPMGGPVLKALEAVADVVAAIADSNLGTPLLAAAGAMSALSLATTGFSKVTGSTAVGSVRALTADLKTMGSVGIVSWARTTEGAEKYAAASGRVRASLAGLGKQAAVVGGLAIATSGLAESTGLSNTASMALMGTIAGPWGAAIGGGVGLVMDFAAANNDLEDAIRAVDSAASDPTGLQAQADALQHLRDTLEDQTSTGHGFLQDAIMGLSSIGSSLDEDTRAKIRATNEELMVTRNALAEVYAATNNGDLSMLNADMAELEEYARKVAPALEAAGISWDEFLSAPSKAAPAIAAYFAEMDTAAGRSRNVGAALKELAGQMESNVTQAEALKNAMDSLFGVELSQSEATDQWTQSLKDLRAQIAETNGALVGNSDAALSNRERIRSNVQALQDKVAADAAAGESGDKLVESLLKGRQAIIDQAAAAGANRGEVAAYLKTLGLTPRNLSTIIETPGLLDAKQQIQALGKLYGLTPKQIATLIAQPGMGKSQADIRAYLKTLGLTPRQINTLMQASTSQAQAAASRLISIYAGIPRYIETQAVTRHIDKFERMEARAGGGYISGPGGPTEDLIPARLSNGEYVVRAKAVQKYGVHMFDRLNAMAFAEGGYVQRFAEGGEAKKRDPFTGKEYARETREFNLTGDQTWREVRSELRDFAREVREAGGHVGRNFDRLSTRAVNVSRALDKHEKALDKARERLGQLRTDRRDYASEVAGTYRHDLFGNGAAGLLLQLQADTNDANAMRAALAQGARRGLDGGLYKALAASGDLNTAQQIARMSRGQIAQYESAYASRQSTTGALGTQAADKVYSASIRQMERAVNAQVRATTKLERRLEGLESAVERGARRGVGDRDRNASTRRRAGK